METFARNGRISVLGRRRRCRHRQTSTFFGKLSYFQRNFSKLRANLSAVLFHFRNKQKSRNKKHRISNNFEINFIEMTLFRFLLCCRRRRHRHQHRRHRHRLRQLLSSAWKLTKFINSHENNQQVLSVCDFSHFDQIFA